MRNVSTLLAALQPVEVWTDYLRQNATPPYTSAPLHGKVMAIIGTDRSPQCDHDADNPCYGSSLTNSTEALAADALLAAVLWPLKEIGLAVNLVLLGGQAAKSSIAHPHHHHHNLLCHLKHPTVWKDNRQDFDELLRVVANCLGPATGLTPQNARRRLDGRKEEIHSVLWSMGHLGKLPSILFHSSPLSFFSPLHISVSIVFSLHLQHKSRRKRSILTNSVMRWLEIVVTCVSSHPFSFTRHHFLSLHSIRIQLLSLTPNSFFSSLLLFCAGGKAAHASGNAYQLTQQDHSNGAFHHNIFSQASPTSFLLPRILSFLLYYYSVQEGKQQLTQNPWKYCGGGKRRLMTEHSGNW